MEVVLEDAVMTVAHALFKDSADKLTFPAAQTIFEEGEEGETMYVIIEGDVDILIGSSVVEQLLTGDIFGEMALVDNSPRSATARARTECTVAPVDFHTFVHHVQNTPEFALQVMSVMANRLRERTRA